MVAFKEFQEIERLPSLLDKQRAWLSLHEGLKYACAIDGHYIAGQQWTKTTYSTELFHSGINMVGRRANQTRIEFDGDETAARAQLEEVADKLREKGWGFIRSSHNGKCDYLWVEFTRNVTDKEITQFLNWISPKGAVIDLNFASSHKVFPCLYAVHWKHSHHRELPVFFFGGEQIDFDSLGLKKNKVSKNVFYKDGYGYETGEMPEAFEEAAQLFSGKMELAYKFIQKQPLYYDKANIWWVWHHEKSCWIMSDEVTLLNGIYKSLRADTINAKERGEIVQALKQVARMNEPKPLPENCIQFKDVVVNIQTGEEWEATSQYFATNSIPFSLHEKRYFLTPTMDRIFEQWVGKEYVKTLYQIIAYCTLPDYPLHRVFCFIGSGMNGKSCFLQLVERFIGADNCCSTELDTLLASRFEVARLHKKLVCQLGETNFNEISKTSMLKKLTGQDLIGLELKNKPLFEGRNYAKILVSTNNLPATTDKTVGFYRRWMIIDFPHTFSESSDILATIPEEEYHALAVRCVHELLDLLKERKFHNEGTIEERMERYESHSNFLERFMKEATEEDINGHIRKSDFYKRFLSWSKENRHRELSEHTVGSMLKKLGYEEDKMFFNWMYDGQGGQARVWRGIKWK